MRVIDGSRPLDKVFPQGRFSLPAWEEYIEKVLPGAGALCLRDLQESFSRGYSMEADVIPVLNRAWKDEIRRCRAEAAFHTVTEGLEERIIKRFGRGVEADVVLYLGLCSGAGWVTELQGRATVLLGLEKIVELEWDSVDAMNGLVLHELGHVYQRQYGVLEREASRPGEELLWKLFTEGIAMVFEQELVEDRAYFHQDRDGWKRWCDDHAGLLAREFWAELPTMTTKSQRYFGDWVQYRGWADTGYYLGARLVRAMMEERAFDELLACDIGRVRQALERLVENA